MKLKRLKLLLPLIFCCFAASAMAADKYIAYQTCPALWNVPEFTVKEIDQYHPEDGWFSLWKTFHALDRNWTMVLFYSTDAAKVKSKKEAVKYANQILNEKRSVPPDIYSEDLRKTDFYKWLYEMDQHAPEDTAVDCTYEDEYTSLPNIRVNCFEVKTDHRVKLLPPL